VNPIISLVFDPQRGEPLVWRGASSLMAEIVP
jgi:hypothetical protein